MKIGGFTLGPIQEEWWDFVLSTQDKFNNYNSGLGYRDDSRGVYQLSPLGCMAYILDQKSLGHFGWERYGFGLGPPNQKDLYSLKYPTSRERKWNNIYYSGMKLNKGLFCNTSTKEFINNKDEYVPLLFERSF